MMHKVLNYIDSLNIQYELLRHPAVVTTEQSKEIIHRTDCCSCKSLYVKDKKSDRFFMVVLEADKRAHMRDLAKYVGAEKFEFATQDRLFADLSVHRGSVSPFAFVNDTNNAIPLLVDSDVWNSDKVKFHPCDNTATVVLTLADLKKFLASLNKQVIVVECPQSAD